MRERRLGATGLRVSRLGLGTMTWGRDTDEHEARDQLTSFVGAGGTLLDTAASYADGDSERVLGSLLGSVVDRSDVVLATKAGSANRRGRRVHDTSRRALLDTLDGSLTRLGVDTVDLWQVHVWSDETPLGETLSALDAAVATGRTRYVGVSNYTGWQTAWAAAAQRAGIGAVELASVQVEHSLLARQAEDDVLPAARALGLGVLAWAPLGRGVLSGKYRTGLPADSRAASPHFESYVGAHLHPDGRRVVEAVVRAAEGLELSPVEVALAWVRDRAGVTAPIVGARTAAQLRGALTSEGVELPAEIVAALDDVSDQ